MDSVADPKMITAVLAAATSVIVATLTYFFKLLGDIIESRRKRRTNLMTIRNEIVLNVRLAAVIEKSTRTLGIRFSDSVWRSVDTSVIYGRKVPAEQILDLYANVQAFNVLNARNQAIREMNKYPDKESHLAVEHAEMVALAEQIGEQSKLILKDLQL